MKSEYHTCFSLTKKGPIDPMIHMKTRLGRVDLAIKEFKEIRSSELNDYIKKLTEKFSKAVGDYYFDTKAFDWDQIREKLDLIQDYPELEKIVFQYICKTLKLPNDYTSDKGEIVLYYYDRIKVGEAVTYYIVRSLVDVYGKEEGTAIYKQIVPAFIREMKENDTSEQPEDPSKVNILDARDKAIKNWCESGLADFTYHIFDDYKIVYRFDRCLVPEVLKEFNDPDIAYLASCYIGDNPEWKEGRAIHMRRTQNLHHAEFCDELYWNNDVHPDAEQPSLEFTKNIGKE